MLQVGHKKEKKKDQKKTKKKKKKKKKKYSIAIQMGGHPIFLR